MTKPAAWPPRSSSARAENAGTIRVSGRAGVWDDNEPENKDAGVWAGFFYFTDETITDGGDATVRNSGDVTVTGAGMTGLRALTYGAGTATVEMTGGTVTASAADDPATDDADESGIGIWAGTGATGTARVTVRGGRVRAPLAARLEGGTTRLTLADGAFLEGDVSFGAGADTLETAGYIGGDVSFGTGEDTLLFDVRDGVASIEGTITGIEDMIKRGTGTARVHDATFAGSSLAVERGSLNVRGHLDLGADGTVTVEDAGRLTMEIGDIAADTTDHGRVTAGGGITLKGATPGVSAAYAPALDAAQRTAAASVLRSGEVKLVSAGTRFTTSSGVAPTLQTTDDETGEAKTVGTLETTETGTTATLNPDEDLPPLRRASRRSHRPPRRQRSRRRQRKTTTTRRRLSPSAAGSSRWRCSTSSTCSTPCSATKRRPQAASPHGRLRPSARARPGSSGGARQ